VKIVTFLLFTIIYSLIFADDTIKVSLSKDEQTFLAENGPITMCVDPDWVPYERINEKGEHEGIAADLVRLVMERIGGEVKLVESKDWKESLKYSKEGRCQILSFLNQTAKREEWLIFTDPIFYDPNVFITRVEHSFISDPAALSGESISFPEGTAMEERIRKNYPNLQVVVTKTEAEAIEAVENGKADMTMRSLIVAAYTIRKEGLFNLKIAGQLPEYRNELRIGVLKEQVMLREIINKGVQTLTPRDREQIANRHVSIEVVKGVDYWLIGKIVLLFLVVLGVIYYWNRRLKSEVDKAVRHIEAQNKIIFDKEKKAAMGDLIGIIAHQLKQPLTTIGMMVQCLEEDYEDERLSLEKVQNYTNDIMNRVYFMSSSIDDLRNFFRPDKIPHIFSISHAIDKSLEILEDNITSKGIKIKINYKKDSEVMGIESELQQVILNILTNAKDAIVEKQPQEKQICITTLEENGSAVIEIEDSGGGIPKEIIGKIFDSYFTTKGEKGTGIGLNLAKMIIEESFGGKISVVNTERGAKFRIELAVY